MELLDKIQSDLTSAIKRKDEKETSALRMLSAAIKNEEISKRPDPLKEDDILRVIKSEVKKLSDAAEQFAAGGRQDLVEQYKSEIAVLKRYLPKEMPEDEVRTIVRNAMEKFQDPSSPNATKGQSKNFGAVMKAAMAELKGRADGSLVSKIVKEELEK